MFLCDLVFDVEVSGHILPASISPELSPTWECMVTLLFPAPGEKDNVCCANPITSTGDKIWKAWARRHSINTNYNMGGLALLWEALCMCPISLECRQPVETKEGETLPKKILSWKDVDVRLCWRHHYTWCDMAKDTTPTKANISWSWGEPLLFGVCQHTLNYSSDLWFLMSLLTIQTTCISSPTYY